MYGMVWYGMIRYDMVRLVWYGMNAFECDMSRCIIYYDDMPYHRKPHRHTIKSFSKPGMNLQCEIVVRSSQGLFLGQQEQEN